MKLGPRSPVIAAGVAAVGAGLTWLVVSRMSGPIVLADEAGPLETARALLGDQAQADTKYYPGHGLVLLPAARLASSAYGEYRAALLTNIALVAATALVIYATLRWIGRRDSSTGLVPHRAALVVTATLSIPYVLANVGIIWSELSLVALSCVAGVLLVAFARLFESPRWRLVMGAQAVTTGVTVLFHPRMFLLLPTAGLAVLSITGLRRWRVTAAWSAITLAAAAAATGLRWWIGHVVGNEAAYAENPPSISLDRFDQVLVGFSGRALATTIALALPLAVLASPRLRRIARSPDLRTLWICGGALVIAQIVTTSIVFWANKSWRLDHLLYTRYQGPGVVLCVLAAGLTVARAPRSGARPSLRGAAAVLGSIAVAGVVFGALRDPDLIRAGTVLPNIPELALVHDNLRWWNITLLAGGVVGAVLLAARFVPGPSVLLGAVTILGVTLSYQAMTQVAIPASENLAKQRGLVAHLEHLPETECVTLDTSVPPFHRSNYEFFSPARFVTVDLRDDEPCGDLVLVGSVGSGRVPDGFEVRAREPFVPISLLARDG